MKMRHFKGKQILSLIRENDYAHAGEEEAINLVMRKIPKDNKWLILDVGCGLGGTAKFIQEHGWGQITGIDIEKESIEYARKTYPEVTFEVCDVVNVPNILDKKFNLIYMFNAFYVFPNQLAALKVLKKVAKDNTQLVIFAYINRDNYIDPVPPFNAIKFPEFNNMLTESGWKLTAVENLDADYERWYVNLIQRIVNKHDAIIKSFGEEAYNILYHRYLVLLQGIKDKKLGGGIVWAVG